MKSAKIIFLILTVIFNTQVLFAQSQTEAYKYAEYERPQGASCDEFFRLVDFVEKLKAQDGKGIIVVYSGDKTARFGNLLAFKTGAKRFLTEIMGQDSDKISIVIAEGKKLFNEEFWIVPKRTKEPKFNQADFDWKNLEDKYLFGETCVTCEPSYGLLTSTQPGYEEYAKVLKENITYKGLIVVGNKEALQTITKTLTTQHKLPKNRFVVQYTRSKNPEERYGESFYIIPNKNVVSNKYSKNDRSNKNR